MKLALTAVDTTVNSWTRGHLAIGDLVFSVIMCCAHAAFEFVLIHIFNLNKA